MNATTKAVLGYVDHNIDSANWGKFVSIFPIPASTSEEQKAASAKLAELGIESAPVFTLDVDGDWMETGCIYA
jgi:hypothetical protein